MKIRQSKALERIFKSGVTIAQKTNNEACAEDIIFICMLGESGCHASHILHKLLKDWEIYQIKIRIEREIDNVAAKSKSQKSSNLDGFCEQMSAIAESYSAVESVINTGHFLIALLGNRESVSSRVLESYLITVPSIHEYLVPLPAQEDYYQEMQALEGIKRDDEPSEFDPGNKKFLAEINDDSLDYDDAADDDRFISLPRAKKVESVLNRFAVNLTEQAVQGKIDPVIGREKEIERLIQILGRRKKNNPILIGEAGVGKSAIVEGLALRLSHDQVPHILRGKRLFSLDMASLVAGTKYRGEFEERIKMLLDELVSNSDVIMFIDEIHTIVGAGSTQGSLDTANILKPALARGLMQCIGATTLDEYRENIESDGALERRFQKIVIEPTTKDETLKILINIKSHYEKHHSVHYTDEALKACVMLTDRYITDRQFPDKAIDVLDEAGSRALIGSANEPQTINAIEKLIEELLVEKRKALSIHNYERAAQLRLREVSLRGRLTKIKSQWHRELSMNPVQITAEHIEQVITSMTGIPVEKVSKDEQHRLREMAKHLSSIVIGQSSAVDKVVKSIQRSRAGLKDPNKPIGVFMFVGPTGVGKTHLAKELSQWLFDKKQALIRIDMSEYSEKHNVSRLIGSPPGYVGYNEGGQLTEAVRRQPYAVILFDEIEKAHSDMYNIMLQIFDDGQLTDGHGNRVDFRNTIIIMTSNVGSKAIVAKGNSLGYNTSNSFSMQQVNKDGEYRKSLESMFAPEFINRIDDIVIFNTLTVADIARIIDSELDKLTLRARDLGYNISITDKAKLRLAEIGYESRYGVRSLKRAITEFIEEPLAQMIVSGEVGDGDYIEVSKIRENIELIKVAV